MAVHVTPGEIATITLMRPEKAHAYDRAMLDALDDAVGRLAGRARVVIVASSGARAFCGGADLDEVGRSTPEDALELRSQRVFTALARAPFVSIAAVHGPAVAGGCELALACDLRVVGPAATFSLPEPRRGLIPAAGGCTRLRRLVGPSRAKQVILGGDVIDADTAIAWGLAHRLADDARAAAEAWAGDIAGADPMALRLAKAIVDRDAEDASLAEERLAEAFLYSRRG